MVFFFFFDFGMTPLLFLILYFIMIRGFSCKIVMLCPCMNT